MPTEQPSCPWNRFFCEPWAGHGPAPRSSHGWNEPSFRSSRAVGGGGRTALADPYELPADTGWALGTSGTHIYQPGFPGRRSGRRVGFRWGSLVFDLGGEGGVVGLFAVDGVSVLAALSRDGDGVCREPRFLESSPLPARLPLVFSDPPGLRLAGSGHQRSQLVVARNHHRHRRCQTRHVALDYPGASEFRHRERSAGANGFRLAGTLAGTAADPRNHGRPVFSLPAQLSTRRSPDRRVRAQGHARRQTSGPGTFQCAAASPAGPGGGCDYGGHPGAAGSELVLLSVAWARGRRIPLASELPPLGRISGSISQRIERIHRFPRQGLDRAPG